MKSRGISSGFFYVLFQDKKFVNEILMIFLHRYYYFQIKLLAYGYLFGCFEKQIRKV